MRNGIGLAMTGLAMTGLALVTGCGGSAGQMDTDPLATTAWTLTALPGADLPAEAAVTARFHEGRIGGRAGCNQYFASYAVRGDSLRIGPAGATKMLCPDPQMAVEDAFLAALADVTTFTVADGLLQVRTAAGGTLVFAPAPFEATKE